MPSGCYQSPSFLQKSADLQTFASCSSTKQKKKQSSLIIFSRDLGDSDRAQVWREKEKKKKIPSQLPSPSWSEVFFCPAKVTFAIFLRRGVAQTSGEVETVYIYFNFFFQTPSHEEEKTQ